MQVGCRLTLEKKRTDLREFLSSVRLSDRCSVGGRVDGLVLGVEDVLGWHFERGSAMRRRMVGGQDDPSWLL